MYNVYHWYTEHSDYTGSPFATGFKEHYNVFITSIGQLKFAKHILYHKQFFLAQNFRLLSLQKYEKEKHVDTIEKLHIYKVTKFGILLDSNSESSFWCHNIGIISYYKTRFIRTSWTLGRLRLECDGTRTETRYRLSAKRTSPFKSVGGVSSVDYWQPRHAHQR